MAEPASKSSASASCSEPNNDPLDGHIPESSKVRKIQVVARFLRVSARWAKAGVPGVVLMRLCRKRDNSGMVLPL